MDTPSVYLLEARKNTEAECIARHGPWFLMMNAGLLGVLGLIGLGIFLIRSSPEGMRIHVPDIQESLGLLCLCSGLLLGFFGVTGARDLAQDLFKASHPASPEAISELKECALQHPQLKPYLDALLEVSPTPTWGQVQHWRDNWPLWVESADQSAHPKA